MAYSTHPIAAPAPFVCSVAIAAPRCSSPRWPRPAPWRRLPRPPLPRRPPRRKARPSSRGSRPFTIVEDYIRRGSLIERRGPGDARERLRDGQAGRREPDHTAARHDRGRGSAVLSEIRQARVDGLKNLPLAFTTLYDAMPDAQKKNADRVAPDFRTPTRRVTQLTHRSQLSRSASVTLFR